MPQFVYAPTSTNSYCPPEIHQSSEYCGKTVSSLSDGRSGVRPIPLQPLFQPLWPARGIALADAVRTDEKRKADAGERGKIQSTSTYYVFYQYSSQGLEF